MRDGNSMSESAWVCRTPLPPPVLPQRVPAEHLFPKPTFLCHTNVLAMRPQKSSGSDKERAYLWAYAEVDGMCAARKIRRGTPQNKSRFRDCNTRGLVLREDRHFMPSKARTMFASRNWREIDLSSPFVLDLVMLKHWFCGQKPRICCCCCSCHRRHRRHNFPDNTSLQRTTKRL